MSEEVTPTVEETKETLPEKPKEINREVAEQAAKEFFDYIYAVKQIVTRKSYSKRGIFRAINYALNDGVTNQVVKLRSKDEQTVAFALGKAIERLIIMRAQLIKERNESNGKEQEVAEDRSDQEG